MAVESAGDRAVFTDADEFGVTAAWSVGGAAAVNVAGLFFNGTRLVAGFEGAGTLNAARAFCLGVEALPAGAAKGDVVTIAGVAYVAEAFRPDQTGWVVVPLEEVVADIDLDAAYGA